MKLYIDIKDKSHEGQSRVIQKDKKKNKNNTECVRQPGALPLISPAWLHHYYRTIIIGDLLVYLH